MAVRSERHDGPTASTAEEAGALQQRLESPERAEAQLTAAADSLRTHEAVDGDGLAAVGISAGAYWALALSTPKSGAVRAVVAFYGSGEADRCAARAA